MRKTDKKKIIIFGLIIAAAIISGIIIQSRERQYRSFFVEKTTLGKEAVTAAPEGNEQEPEALHININTDNPKELEMLDGIGETTAKRIIGYRKAHGNFEVIEDLMRVSGIGEKKFKAIKDYIYVAE